MSEVWLSRLHSARLLRLLRWGSVVIPLFIAVVAGVVTWRNAVEDARRQAEVNASLLRDFLYRLVEVQDLMLTAADAALDRARLDADGGLEMHEFLSELQRRLTLGVGLALVSPTGEFLLSSLAHPVEGSVGPRDYLTAPYGGRSLFIDRIQVQPSGFEAMIVARRREGPHLPGVWVSGVQVEAVEAFLGRIVNARDSVALVVRGDGRLLLRRPAAALDATLPPDSEAMRAISQAPSGVYEAESVVDGKTRIYAYSRVGRTPLYAVYGVSKRVLLTEWLKTFAGVLGVLGALSLTGFGLAKSAIRSVEAEAAQAALAFNRRLLAEANKTAQAREMMLRELNHRVKNSLQMIRSLVRLQAQRPGGPDLDAIVSRVMAIASIHDLLYRSASSFDVDLADLLGQILVSDAIVPPESHIVIERRLEHLTVDANVATPVALCVVELVTNAAKHAFGPEGGKISVTLSREGDMAVLTVADDGGGLPEEPVRNSGLRVVEALVLQLDGALRVWREGGTRFEITFAPADGAQAENPDAAASGDAPRS